MHLFTTGLGRASLSSLEVESNEHREAGKCPDPRDAHHHRFSKIRIAPLLLSNVREEAGKS